MRKKLKWNYKPFEIPQEILDEWRKIGQKGELLEKKWKILIKKDKKIKNELEQTYLNSDLKDLGAIEGKNKIL